MQEVDQEGLMKMLRSIMAGYKNQHEFAKACGVSDGFLSDILRGRRDVSVKILDHIGIKRVVVYRPKEYSSS
jgi:transcriptional regulator with XRE-family HTH domain